MSKVDWSLAPNWATHALVKLHNPGIGGVHWSYFIDGEHRISPDGLWFHPDGYRVAEERPRNVKPKPWSGPEDGLPPVGIECEYNPMVPTAFMPTYLKWSKVRIVTHDVQIGDTYALFYGLNGYCGNRRPECFRAIRTPEQIAADLRETAIRELMDVADVDCRVTAARLVDAGFKREVV